MTFSLVARSADGASWGVAVASKFLAAGAVVPAARAGQGAVATQSFVNLHYLPDGLELLAAGRSAADTVAALTSADDLRASRQVGVVGPTGDGAAFTGDECIPWAGSRSGDGWSAQGNCLAGPEVLEAMETAFLASGETEPLAHRLLAGSRAHWQINVWTREGTAQRVEATIGAVRDPQGRVTHWVAAFATVPSPL